MELPVEAADTILEDRRVEHRPSSVSTRLSRFDQIYQHHFHFPPVSLRSLAEKWRTKAPGRKKQQGMELTQCCPETDIRETIYAYHIEIALPGVHDKERLVIQWMSPRTLLVQGDISRPYVGRGKHAEGERQWEGDLDGFSSEVDYPPKCEAEQDGGKLRRVLSNDADAEYRDVPFFILNERTVGLFQRTFTLPLDVDMKGLKAKLEDGLLRIDLPRKDLSGEPKMKVRIE